MDMSISHGHLYSLRTALVTGLSSDHSVIREKGHGVLFRRKGQIDPSRSDMPRHIHSTSAFVSDIPFAVSRHGSKITFLNLMNV